MILKPPAHLTLSKGRGLLLLERGVLEGYRIPIFIKESLFEDKRPIPGIHLFSKCVLRDGCDVSTTEEEEMKQKGTMPSLQKSWRFLWQYWPVHFASAIVYCQHTLGQAVLYELH